MQVTANGRTARDILTAGFYRVPRFQRPYSWDRSNVEDFWLDVVDNPLGYFIGAMVIYEDGHDGAGLVDGQQRLTTITMLLAALRNEFQRLTADDEAQGIQTLIERRDLTNKILFVLGTETSYPYLQGQIQSMPPIKKTVAATAEEKALEQAFTYISERTRELSDAVDKDPAIAEAKRPSARIERLTTFRDKVLALTIVLVEVDDQDDATVIFQTLNSRGKDLETADLVKAHLFTLLKPKNPSFDQIRDSWNGIVASFDESAVDISMNRFLLHSWLSRRDYVGEKQLFKSIRSYVRPNNADDYLEDLVADAKLYRIAQEPAYKQWAKTEVGIRQSLVALMLFRLRQPLPMVLALLRELERKTLKPRMVLKGLQTIEHYHFVATAVTNQPSSGGVSRMYAYHARELLTAKTDQRKADSLDELRAKLRQRRPTYDQFESSFVELRSSRVFAQQTPLVRYVLGKLHVAASEGALPEELNTEALTVEHLAPQRTPGSRGLLGYEVARIGNLLLVTQKLNEALGNKTFAAKREILRTQAVGAEQEILDAGDWGRREIVARAKRLAKRAYDDVWTL